MEKLLVSLIKTANRAISRLRHTNYPMTLSDKEQLALEKGTICWVCRGALAPKDAVQDHNHLIDPNSTGKSNFRGWAHNSCNLKIKQQLFLPVFIHNSNYDLKFVLPALAHLQRNGTVDDAWVIDSFSYKIIPKSSEKLLVLEFMWKFVEAGVEYTNKIRFLDSYSFFPKSLSELIQVQKNDDGCNAFPLLKQQFPNDLYDLLTVKGIYPYDHYCSMSRFAEEAIPPIESFYDSLHDRSCTPEEYSFAKKVWAAGGCKNGFDYCKLYLSSDVLTLLDIMCKNTDKIYEEFNLDLGYYFSSPHLVMDLILKISGEKIGLITDIDQHLFIERSMRGGFVFHGDRILETDPTGEKTGTKSNAVFLDMNSLYPSAMSHYALPCGDYKWLNDPQAPHFPNIDSVEENGPVGWFFEIDGEIPVELHDSVKDFVFPCINRPVTKDSLSPRNRRLVEVDGLHWAPSKQKLIADLLPKKNIVVHHVALKWMCNNGFNVTKVHRALEFSQKPYLKTFVDTFVSKRSAAKTKAEKEIYKLILNSAFGKMCESVRNRNRCDVVTDPEQCARIIADPNYTSFTIIGPDMVLLNRKKRRIVLNKNIAAGSAILEISKKLMLEFYYNVARVQWPEKGQVEVCYGDTDSLLLKVKTSNLIDDLAHGEIISSRMDYTNWSVGLYPELVKRRAPNQLLFLKSETGSDLISRGMFVGPKVYFIQTHDEEIKKRCKGVPTRYVDKNFNMDIYRNCITENTIPRAKLLAIRSLKYKNYTVNVEKIAMSTISDKVYVCQDGVTTLPLGHYLTSDRIECIAHRESLGLNKVL